LLREGCRGLGNRRVRVSLLHLATQARTEQLHAERSRERRVRDPQTDAEHRQLATALSSGEGQQMAHAVSAARRHAAAPAVRRGDAALTGLWAARSGVAGAASLPVGALPDFFVVRHRLRRAGLSAPGLARRLPRNARPARRGATRVTVALLQERGPPTRRTEPQVRQRQGWVAQQVYLRAQVDIEFIKANSLYRT
jgi:hypothetical protein